MSDNYYPIEFDDNGGFTVVNNGTAPAPCKITFVPKVDFINLEITGLSKEPIRVSNIKANQTLVIDGEEREVLLDEQDYFDKYDAWEFPKLMPGVNVIQISNGGLASVAIEYTQRFI